MKNVYLDGEEVLFDGPTPEDMPTLQALLANHLATTDRILTRWIVDGIDLIETPIDPPPTRFNRIDAHSLPQSEVFKNLLLPILGKSEETKQQLENYSNELLTLPWATQSQKLGTIITQLMPVIELLGHLESDPKAMQYPWHTDIKSILKEFNHIVEQLSVYAKNNDIAALSELFYSNTLPLLNKTYSMLQDSVQKTLAAL